MIYTGKAAKISLYINSGRKTAAQIKAETGCTAIINGGIYNMSTFKPLCHLKADGKIYAADQYKYFGFAWDANELRLVTDYVAYKNYICCVCMVRDGAAVSMLYNADMGGARPRTAIGVFGDGRVWMYASSEKLTPEELQQIALAAGVKHAIMLDGGGSTQCIFPEGEISSTRRVHNYVCVWEENTAKDDANMNGESIKVYSKAKDGSKKLSTNFKVREFACKDGSDAVFISPELVTILQKVRTHFGKAVKINSAYRTPQRNKSEGGETYSQHLYGMAADIVVEGVAAKTVAAYVEKLMPNSGGIGTYASFVHVDVRADKSRWNG